MVGALIAARQPDNLVGWVLCAAGMCSTLGLASDAYTDYALVTAPGSLPGGVWVAWAGALWVAPFFMLVVALLPLLFPTGRLLSPRWRLVAWSGLAFMLLTMIGNALQPDAVPVSGLGIVDNPLGVPTAWTPWLDGLINLGALLLVPASPERWPRWWYGSGAPGVSNASSSSGAATPPRCCRCRSSSVTCPSWASTCRRCCPRCCSSWYRRCR